MDSPERHTDNEILNALQYASVLARELSSSQFYEFRGAFKIRADYKLILGSLTPASMAALFTPVQKDLTRFVVPQSINETPVDDVGRSSM